MGDGIKSAAHPIGGNIIGNKPALIW